MEVEGTDTEIEEDEASSIMAIPCPLPSCWYMCEHVGPVFLPMLLLHDVVALPA